MKFEFYKNIELDAEIEALKSILEKHEIPFEISSADVIIDSRIVGQGMFAKYTIKLLQKDFEKTNKLIRDLTNEDNILIADYEHLKALTDDELIEILVKPSEWSVESEIAAKKILKSRNTNVSFEAIEEMKHSFYLDKRKGKSVSSGIQFSYFIGIILGFYINIIFIIAGIGMGYYYAYGKTIDPNGNKYFVYDKKARDNGIYILYGGLIAFVIQMYLLFKIDIF